MSIAKEYADLQSQMNLGHLGHRLRQAAEAVLGEVLAGEPTTFISTSETGAGLAAVCAALYEGPARWSRLNLLVPVDLPPDSQNVVVELVDGGEAWRHALARRVGPHVVVIPRTVEQRLALA